MEKMRNMLTWLEVNRPHSGLIPLYQLAVAKEAVIELDTMWRMVWRGEFYSANNIDVLATILKAG